MGTWGDGAIGWDKIRDSFLDSAVHTYKSDKS